MTDYQEEQAHEIEALDSIYPDELQIVTTEPFHSFRMAVTSQCSDDIENAVVIVQFTFTEKYPDEMPVIEILSVDNIELEDTDVLSDLLKEQAEENLGMVMIFTLVSALQEKLTDLVESASRRVEEEKERKIQEEEEAERKRLEGTRVTIESFLAWKEKFDAEMKEKKRLSEKIVKDNTKPTGKELFMQDHTLDDSDMKFLEEEGGEAVAVDESLFQDLDDLDLDDDPDFDIDAAEES